MKQVGRTNVQTRKQNREFMKQQLDGSQSKGVKHDHARMILQKTTDKI